MPSKCLLIVLDGLGDRAYAELGHRTPLQAAHTPFLDELATRGANGLYHAASLGVALPSENAHFAMFGYDMAEFPGRGALEALGAGIPLGPKDVAILAHFASVSIVDRVVVLEAIRPGTTEEEALAAFSEIGAFRSDGVDFRLHRTHGVDGVLTLSGDVSPFITDSDTMQTGRPLIAIQP
ncbi:MAG: phosphoglycerate mutase, partial [Deltaproteobacteria bacterium]|nr:phosphoglycerate mutase [Deltaproteobacteria bacterium]